MLQDIRGVENVDEEFNDICAACKQAQLVVNPWRNLLRPAYRPQLVIALTATLFQQWTGINTCVFYPLHFTFNSCMWVYVDCPGRIQERCTRSTWIAAG